MVTAPAPAVLASAPTCPIVTAPVSVAAEAAIFNVPSVLVPPMIPPIPTVPEPLMIVRFSWFPPVAVALIVVSKSIFPA